MKRQSVLANKSCCFSIFFLICRSHQEDLPHEQITHSRSRYSVANNIDLLTHNANKFFYISCLWHVGCLDEFLEHFSCGSKLDSTFYILLLLQCTSCNFMKAPEHLSNMHYASMYLHFNYFNKNRVLLNNEKLRRTNWSILLSRMKNKSRIRFIADAG